MDLWEEYENEKIKKNFATRETDPDYPRLVEKARARGYEPAPLSSLLVTGNEADLYTWQGRVWKKLPPNAELRRADCGANINRDA